MPERISAIVSDLMAAASNAASHSENHPSVETFCKKVLEALNPLFTGHKASFSVSGYTLRFNDFLPVSTKSLAVGVFVDKLRRKGIERVTLRQGVSARELGAFAAALIPADRMPISSAGIEIHRAGTLPSREHTERLSEVMAAAVRIVKESHGKIRRGEKMDLEELERLVLRFIQYLETDQNILEVMKAYRADGDYTFVHAVRVSLLGIYLAKAIGLQGDHLHEVGLAGLLYDVGRLFIPAEILDKKDALEEAEREIIHKHPVYGAMYLAALEDVPKLAVVSAFEHHMKFDGTGYPETRWRDRNQHIVSQIVALADHFDALRAQQTYRKAYAIPLIVKKMNEGVGKEFNPVLVQEFVEKLAGLGVAV